MTAFPPSAIPPVSPLPEFIGRGAMQQPLLARPMSEANSTLHTQIRTPFSPFIKDLWSEASSALDTGERLVLMSCEIAGERPGMSDILVLAKARMDSFLERKTSRRSADSVEAVGVQAESYNRLVHVVQTEVEMEESFSGYRGRRDIPWVAMGSFLENVGNDGVVDEKLDLMIEHLAMLAQIVNRFTLLEDVQLRKSGHDMDEIKDHLVSLYTCVLEYLVNLRRIFDQPALDQFRTALQSSNPELKRLSNDINFISAQINISQQLFREHFMSGLRNHVPSPSLEDQERSLQLAKVLQAFDNVSTPDELHNVSQELSSHYSRILTTTDSVIGASTFKWLICEVWERQSLRPADLVSAVSTMLPSTLGKLTTARIVNASQGFVTFDENTDSLRFGHPSVRFLLEVRPEYSYGTCHAYLAQGCLARLVAVPGSDIAKKELKDNYGLDTGHETRPGADFLIDGFQKYANRNWMIHLREAGEDERSSGTLRALFRFFLLEDVGQGSPFDHWFRWYDRQDVPHKMVFGTRLTQNIYDFPSPMARAFLVACDRGFVELVEYTASQPQIDTEVLEAGLIIMDDRAETTMPILSLLIENDSKFVITDEIRQQLIRIGMFQRTEEDAIEVLKYVLDLCPNLVITNVESIYWHYGPIVYDYPEALKLLLGRVIKVDMSAESAMSIPAFSSRPESLEVLLDHIQDSAGFRVTEAMLFACVKNHDTARLEVLLKRGGGEWLTAKFLQELFSEPQSLSGYQARPTLELILELADPFLFTEEIVTLALEMMNWRTFGLLLDRFGNHFLRSERVLLAACSASAMPTEAHVFLLDMETDFTVTEELLLRLITFQSNRAGISDMLRAMLSRGAVVTQDVVERAADRSSFEVFKVLLDHGGTVTEEVVRCALQNQGSGAAILEHAVEHYPHVEMLQDAWSMLETCLREAKAQFRAPVISWLLERAKGDHIPPKITDALLQNPKMWYPGQLKAIQLFLDNSNKTFTITEDILTFATEYAETPEIVLTLHERAKNLTITSRLLEAAVKNANCGDDLFTYFAARADGAIEVSQELFVAAAANELCGERLLQLLSTSHGSMIFTEAVLQSAARDGTVKNLLILLDANPETPITEALVFAALSNEEEGEHMIETFLAGNSNPPFTPTPAFLHTAATNPPTTGPAFHALLDHTPNLTHIPSSTLTAVLNNADSHWRNARSILSFLLHHKDVTADITPEILYATVADPEREALMRPFLSYYHKRREEMPLSRELVCAALRHGQRGQLWEDFGAVGVEVSVTEEVVEELAKGGEVEALEWVGEEGLWDEWSENWVEVARRNRVAEL